MTDHPYIIDCPVGCGEHFSPTDIILPEGPLLRCESCGQLVSQCSESRYQESMQEFDDPLGTWPKGRAAKRLALQTRRILARLEDLLGKKCSDMHLLDVGCSNGAFIACAAACGVAAEGVEPSAGPAAAAIKAGLPVRQGFLEELALKAASFDAITLFEVIEHLREPTPLLRECRRLLKPGGVMVLRTGNTDSWSVRFMKERWLYFHIRVHGGHISFFNPHSMRLLAERCGFSLEKIKTHSVGLYEKGDIPFVLYRLAKLVSESLNGPAKLAGKGHEMMVFLRKVG